MGCRRGLFVSILFTFLVAAHSAFAADSHVQGPANLESDQIQIEKQFPLDVWPEGNTDPCPEFLDGAFQLVENIASECGERFYSKGSDYSIIAAHGVAVCFIPELLPAFIHEIKEEGKKDLLYCVLAGVAETTDWPAEEKAAWKAGLNAILEVRDSMGDVTAVPEAQKYLEKNPLAKLNTPNADDLIDRFKQQWKEWEKHHSSVLEAFTKGKEVVGNPALFAGWNVYGAGQTLEVLLAGFQGKESVFDERAEAVRELKKTCDDQLTLTAITYALTAGQDWLQSVRLARRASAKSLMCTEKEYAKIEKIGNRSGGVYREFTASVQREKEDLKSKISGFERQDQEIQSKMRALMKDYLDVKSTQAQLELDKAAVRTRLESAEGMAAKCDFKQAHQELQDIYKKMVNPCGQPIAKLDQIAATKRIGELESQLHSDERKIQYFFNESTKAILCSELESAIRSIEGLRDQNQCVGRESATKKVADLQKLISDSTKAENDLQNRLIEATSFLDKCDVTAATTAIAKAQEARERIKCRDRLHEESEFTALVGKGETVKAATKKLLEETAKILEHAERARENCDDARLQADSEQLVQLIQEFSSICKSTPAAADKAKARIRTLLTMGTDKDMPKQVAALVAHATAALKKCDQLAVGMDAAALELIGKDCGYDGIAEAKKLRSASEGLTKAEDSLSQNVAAIRSKMEGLVSEACNDNEAKQLHQEASRLVDQHTKSCTSVPSSVSTDLGLIENLHQSIPAEINKRLKFAASAKGEALSVVKSCDLVAIMEAADELQKVPCLDDAENRAEALRQAGKQIAKSHESLMANIDALHGKARAADAACDSEGVKSIYFEAGRLADAFSAKCPKFSPETGATLAAIQGIAESSEQRVAGEKEIVALFHQVEVAWKACRFSEAKTLIEQMDKLQAERLTNRACPPPAELQRTGSMKVDGYAVEQASGAIEAAIQLYESCEPVHAVEKQLQFAEMRLRPLQMSRPECDWTDVKGAIAELRAGSAKMEKDRQEVTTKTKEGYELINKGKRREGKALIGEAVSILEKADPAECFLDLNQAIQPNDRTPELDNIPGDDEEQEEENDPEEEEDNDAEVEEIPEDEVIEEIPEVEATPAVVTPSPTPTLTPQATQQPTPEATSTPWPTSAFTPIPVVTSWRQKEVKVEPEKRPEGWTYSDGSAFLKIYNGDSFAFAWTPPPPTFGRDGVTITVSVTSTTGPNSRIAAGSIGAWAKGMDASVQYDARTADAVAEMGSKTASKTVTFKPHLYSSDIEISVGFQWGVTYRYIYTPE